jgi:tripartite ATP-independent transporter DctM subunit
MDPNVVGYLGLIALVLALIAGINVGVSLGLVGFFGFWVLTFSGPALGLMSTTPYQVAANYDLSVLPLFLLMGITLYHGGLAKEIYTVANKWFGRFSGSLILATLVASAGFGAISGSSVAAAAVFTRSALPEMLRYNYDKKIASGVIAAAGTLSSLIPPSAILVFYAILTEQSVGQLLIAGVLPGILSVFLYAGMIIIRCKFNPSLAPKMPTVIAWREKISALGEMWPLPVLIIVVLAGLYFGIFTSTEAGAFGAFGAFVVVFIRKKLTWENMRNALLETARTTSMIFVIIIGAILFSRFLAVSRIPTELIEMVSRSHASPLAIMILILFLYVIMGMFLDAFGMLALTVPIVLPVIIELGYDPIWYGVMMVKIVEIGLITPPLGINVYTVKGAAGAALALEDVFRGTFPFLAMDIVTVTVLLLFPEIATWLPSRMR